MKPSQTLLNQSAQWRGETKNKRKGPTTRLEIKTFTIGARKRNGKKSPPPSSHKKHVKKVEGNIFHKEHLA
jgi:hypothetical protein